MDKELIQQLQADWQVIEKKTKDTDIYKSLITSKIKPHRAVLLTLTALFTGLLADKRTLSLKIAELIKGD